MRFMRLELCPEPHWEAGKLALAIRLLAGGKGRGQLAAASPQEPHPSFGPQSTGAFARLAMGPCPRFSGL